MKSADSYPPMPDNSGVQWDEHPPTPRMNFASAMHPPLNEFWSVSPNIYQQVFWCMKCRAACMQLTSHRLTIPQEWKRPPQECSGVSVVLRYGVVTTILSWYQTHPLHSTSPPKECIFIGSYKSNWGSWWELKIRDFVIGVSTTPKNGIPEHDCGDEMRGIPRREREQIIYGS